MSEPISAYPLQWPAGWKRTAYAYRKRASFGKGTRQYTSDGQNSWTRKGDLSVTDGTTRVLQELERLGVRRDDIVISTNVRLRLDGLPRSGERAPEDPGAAVYWRAKNETRCMAVDRYDRVADNLAAIAATLEAMRAIERHGGAAILDRAFTGFTALPSPEAARPWRETLGSDIVSREQLEARYRALRSQHHPDKGGSADMFDRVQKAYEAAGKELA